MPREPNSSVDSRVVRLIHGALILLSFSAGAADAFAFLAVGGIFTANMTGNLILIGMFSRPEFGLTLLAATVAIVSFGGVVYGAFRLTSAPTSAGATAPAALRRLILPSLALQTMVVIIWAVAPGSGTVERCTVIALSAAALALQTVAAKKVSDIDGLTTTYVTGTITATMQHLAEHKDEGQRVRMLSILALPVGAVCATAVFVFAEDLGPVVAWVAAGLAALMLRHGSDIRDEGGSPPVGPRQFPAPTA